MTTSILERFLQSIKTVFKPTANTFKPFSKKPSPSIAKTFVFLLLYNLIITGIYTATTSLISVNSDSESFFIFLFIVSSVYIGFFIFTATLGFIFSVLMFIFAKLFGRSGSIKQLVHSIAILWILFSTISLITSIYYQFLISSNGYYGF